MTSMIADRGLRRHRRQPPPSEPGPATTVSGVSVAAGPDPAQAVPRGRTPVWLLVAAIALLALNLRPAVVSVGPLASRIRADTGMSSASVSLLTALPLVCFGAFAVIGPRLGRRLGMERALAIAYAALVGGIALRLVPGEGPLFAGSALAGAGIAIANVLLAGLIKRDFPERAGVMMSMYSVMLIGGATLAAGLTVPLRNALHAGWRPALGIWGILAAAALIVWIPVAVRGHTRPSDAQALGGRVWRSRLSWWLAAYMAAQSLIFYGLTAWLSTLLQDHGVSDATSGVMLSVFNFVGIGSALATPIFANRRPTQRGLVLVVGGVFALGLTGLLVAPRAGAWAWMALLGIGQGMSISLGLSLFVLRTRSAPAAAELSGMAQTVGYLIAALGPVTVGALHGATGRWSLPLVELLAVDAVVFVAGWVAAGDRKLEDELP
jgi:MFS transporter, CP family, cyanate transporter